MVQFNNAEVGETSKVLSLLSVLPLSKNYEKWNYMEYNCRVRLLYTFL